MLFMDRPDYPVKRIDLFGPNGNLLIRMSIVASKNIAGLGYPIGWKTQSFSEGKLESTQDVNLTILDLQPEFTSREFSLDFPIGTYVTNLQDKERTEYIVREGGNRIILPEERGSDYHALANSNTGDLAQSAVRKSNTWSVLMYLGSGCIGLALLYGIGQWYRRGQVSNSSPNT